jgi:hypothetical protein
MGGLIQMNVNSNCSVTCGPGVKYRICNNPAPSGGGLNCSGEAFASCNLMTCPGAPVNGNWSDYGPCSTTCGDG